MKSWTALIATASFLAALALASPPEAGPPVADMERMAILLDLTDEQKAQVKAILEEQQGKVKEFSQPISEGAVSGKPEEFNQPVPKGAVPGEGQGIKAGRQVRQETLTKLQAVLTPEQIKKFEALTEKRVYQYRVTAE
jgi:Spy/CpxP family protein refolding chaperone